MRNIKLVFSLLLLVCTGINGSAMSVHGKPDSFVIKKSCKPPPDVVKDLKLEIQKRGLKLFYEIPHHSNADKNDHLRFTHVLVFGNPQVGTKLMLCDQYIGFELPLRILVMFDEQGQTTITYLDPRVYARAYNMEKCTTILESMAKTLDDLTNACI